VQLEDGALFRGSIDMNPPKAAEAEKPATSRPAATATRTDSSGNGQKAQASAASKGQPPVTSAAKKEPSLNLKSG